MAKKTVNAKIPGHKDPVRYPVILQYEGEFHRNFSLVGKLIIKGIKENLQNVIDKQK